MPQDSYSCERKKDAWGKALAEYSVQRVSKMSARPSVKYPHPKEITDTGNANRRDSDYGGIKPGCGGLSRNRQAGEAT